MYPLCGINVSTFLSRYFSNFLFISEICVLMLFLSGERDDLNAYFSISSAPFGTG